MTWQKPTEKFPSADEGIRWWCKTHFEDTQDPKRQVWASDLYASYLEACKDSGLPLVSAARFGRCMTALAPRSIRNVYDDGQMRRGNKYAIGARAGVAIVELGTAGKGYVHHLYREALRSIGTGSVWDDGAAALKREQMAVIEGVLRCGFLSTIDRTRKKVGVVDPVNEARVTSIPTVELFTRVHGPLAGNTLKAESGQSYVRFLGLVETNFIVERLTNGHRTKMVTVERIEDAAKGAA